MQERIEIMARRTWEAIGGDILTVLEEQGMKPIIGRDELLECVSDASYMKMYGDDKEAYTFWNNLPTYDAKLEAIKDAFPHQRYGW